MFSPPPKVVLLHWNGWPGVVIVPLVKVEVLGPIRVWNGGTEVALGRPQQRLVLALLVEAGGRVLTTDQLIDGVWGDDVPDRARKTIQVHVSKLRRALDDRGAIETTGGGYRLSERIDSDIEHFERLIAVGREELPDQPERAGAVLRQALRMWRGPPYADFRDEQALQSEIRRIEELRLGALEDRLTSDIATGRENAAAADLVGLIEQYPLRERLQLLYMRALYRMGRQTDALANYRMYCSTLADQLGLDPSPELQDLELAILLHDPGLGPAPQHHVRNPLPVRYSSFLGRDEEVADIRDRLSRHRLVTIAGLGGIGKSSLAVEALRGLEDAVDLAYVDVESALPGDVAVTTARALGLLPRSEDDAEALICRVAAKSALMLLLDGCEDAVAAVAGMSDRLLRASPELRVLVTSREALNLPGESLLVLGPLEHSSKSPAAELFLDRLGVRAVDQQQHAAVATICDRLDGIPLAIELAAVRARSVPLSRVAALLDRHIDLVVDRRRSDDRQGSLGAALDSSYRALTEDRKRALRSLAVFRGGFEPDGAGYVIDVGDAAEILGDLVATSFLPPPSPRGHYRMLEPVRQYAWSLAEAADETEKLAHRHADWNVQLARYCKDRQHTAAQNTVYERAATQHGELLAAIRWSLSGDASHAVAIVAALGRLWYSVGIDQQLRVLMLETVQHPEVKPSTDLAVAMGHTGFAWYFEEADPHALSLVEQAVEMARDIDDDGAVGTTLTRLAGVVSDGLGDLHRGLELELEGYELLHQSRHPDAEQEAYNLAQHLAAVGRLEEASRLLRESIEWGSTTGSPTGAATALFGHYLIAQGQLVEGLEASERGVEMLERLGRYHTLIAQTYFLGLAYSLAGRHDEAIAMLHRSVACWDQIGREVLEEWRPPLDVAKARASSPDRDATSAAIRSWIESKVSGAESEGIGDGPNQAAWTMPSELLLIAHPASVVIDDEETAALVGASALRLMMGDQFGGWESASEIGRLRNHLERLPAPGAPLVATQQDLLVLLAETFGANHLPGPC